MQKLTHIKLKNMKNNNDTVVLKGNKGSEIVIMVKDYVTKSE